MLAFLFGSLIVGMIFYIAMTAFTLFVEWEIISNAQAAIMTGLIAILLLALYSILALL